MTRGANKVEENTGSQVREEPEQPATKLEFKADQRLKSWVIEKSEDPTPVIPRYMAELYIRWYHGEPNDPNGTALLKTSAGKSLSDLQRGFIRAERAIVVTSSSVSRYSSQLENFPWGRKRYSLFAVSEADAKKMAFASVEFLAQRGNTNAQRRMKNHLQKLLDVQKQTTEKIAQAEEQLPDKKNESTAAFGKYKDAVKNSIYSLHSLDEVPDELKKTIFDMNKMLDTLNIEIAGIKAKISAIERYTSHKDVLNSPDLKVMLAQMSIRENIELIGAETRRKAILNGKKYREYLYGLYNHRMDLEKECVRLRGSSNRGARGLRAIEKELAELQASRAHSFEVLGNTVTIYPVRVRE
jgi:chromosome segregation ATPase